MYICFPVELQGNPDGLSTEYVRNFGSKNKNQQVARLSLPRAHPEKPPIIGRERPPLSSHGTELKNVVCQTQCRQVLVC